MDQVIEHLPTEDLAFHVEQHGIDLIPLSERWATPRAVAGLWAGASLNIEYLVYGAILATFGFSFVQSVIIIVIGNLSWFLVGLTSLQGPQAGTTTFGVNRAPFGPNGSRLISTFNWFTQIGFEIEGIILIVYAGTVLAYQGGVHDAFSSTLLKSLLIVGAVAVQVVMPFLGHATMVKVLRWLILPFIAIYIVLGIITAQHADVSAPAQPWVNWQLWTAGLAFVIALSGLGWTENGNDFSRYCRPDVNRRSLVGWLFAATALPEMALMTLGAAVVTFIGTGEGFSNSWNLANPFVSFLHQRGHAMPGWLTAVVMCFLVVQLFGINSLDLYSSGVTLQAIGVRLKRYQAVLLDSLICLGFTFYAVFDARFTTLLKDFVEIVIVWISAWCGIYLTDWLLRRRTSRPDALQQTGRTSPYWGTGGVSWPAIVAQLAGMFAALEMTTNTATFLPEWLHALPVDHGGFDFSVFAGFFIGAIVYAALGWGTVQRQEGRLLGSG